MTYFSAKGKKQGLQGQELQASLPVTLHHTTYLNTSFDTHQFDLISESAVALTRKSSNPLYDTVLSDLTAIDD